MASQSDKRESFIRLAEGRTSKVIEAARLLGNLSNLSRYHYDQADVESIRWRWRPRQRT